MAAKKCEANNFYTEVRGVGPNKPSKKEMKFEIGEVN